MSEMSQPEAMFLLMIHAHELPEPVREWRFCERMWRFDFAWPEKKVAVEVEGGVWIQGRHARGTGFIGDCEKYNRAALLGWKVLRYIPHMFDMTMIDQIREALK